MNFQDELFQGQDAYEAEHGIHPDIIFVRYDVWCEMFGPVRAPAEGKGIYLRGTSYVPMRMQSGPMFQFSDREFMGRAFAVVDPHKTDASVIELVDYTVGRIADWNPSYCTPVAVPVPEPKTRTISIELMKRWKESF